ncbi:TetR/AcrR family transcriptional regulator [Leptospira wolffii]|uniref:TetR/AcrR family transcriptional regulator n=1 Tax=Leptospira wolffii TaxID=409998 RepID=UPI0010830B80|nr:TetR/AcrR family transcriptional regulator [Leptospira wolffii]TGK55909.1 TetR/AcrR family transcriptional regulator [Leptospira wolffii]TGK75778.1 TetR/AcrR family transcriptional regulator [Leptospira wolffii]TGK75900.1 TetR/AcrR family transcriptional regulator [Leptospira wolffii]TGL27532.1 TetR/AcrR family transcriptional regulator [Leptospira wolffii]
MSGKKEKIPKREPDEERRKEILDAALHCFLQFGYSKTSMDDIAKQAELSRPLLYLKFKNKEDLFQGIFEHLMEGCYPKAEETLKEKLSPKEKLSRICEILLLEPWTKIEGHPKSREFYETCSKLSPESVERYEHRVVKSLQSVLGDKEKAEVFFLAMEGMSADIPSTKVLRKRMSILIDSFLR